MQLTTLLSTLAAAGAVVAQTPVVTPIEGSATTDVASVDSPAASADADSDGSSVTVVDSFITV